jgi:GxxExxY protein
MDIYKKYLPLSEKEERIAKIIFQAALEVHRRLGPGLLESVYETCFCHELTKRGASYRRQVSVPIRYDGLVFKSALRLDVVVEECVICELKSVEMILQVHHAQVLSHLKLTKLRLGFLINFNSPTLRQGLKRIIL